MASGNDGLVSCSSSSSLKLLLLMIPLLVISGCISVLGSRNSGWGFISRYPWLSSSATAATVTRVKPVQVPATKEKERLLDLHSTVVGVHRREEAISEDSVLNRSSSPPLDVAAAQPPPAAAASAANGTEKVSLDISKRAGPLFAASLNETHALPVTSRGRRRRRRQYTTLEKLEAGLRRARSGIREAKTVNRTTDPDYIPNGPIYWNDNTFHRSYLEMEKQLKVFVYNEGEPPLFHNGPCKSIYSMEGNFIHRMEMDSHFRTKDPEKAHLFFLPFSVAMLVRFVYVRDSHDFGPIKQTVIDYVNVVSTKYPYWNRSLGADHFMLACHDWGPETSSSVPYLRKNSIRVLCNANTSEGFNPSKDVSFPEINLLTGSTEGFIGGPSPSRRPQLAFFAGGLHGPIRPILLEHWENRDEDVKVHKYLPKGVSYYDMMRKSKYCLCPSGYEVASPRVVEALYTGCVPVLISDHYVPPFSDVLNWKSFSVEVPVREIPNLKKILMSISTRQYIRMQRRGVQARRHFEVNSPPKRYDVFHMILHSLWLRRLNVRIRHHGMAE